MHCIRFFQENLRQLLGLIYAEKFGTEHFFLKLSIIEGSEAAKVHFSNFNFKSTLMYRTMHIVRENFAEFWFYMITVLQQNI